MILIILSCFTIGGLQSPEKSPLHAVSNRGDSPGSTAHFFTSLPVESPQVLHPPPASLALLAVLS